ncbi:DUF4838 domain-containing protein [Dyadobacter sp. LHD-138]|uniref:DUF4838 domain-containing protein n=1 Tax=Dyadobacter sp. LHD-138 TaxID=3071413 RepID=UPI0027DF840A|nr:DUF4838 domain-containing protein [Dyadobacter sp. LHD-138]MDQ6480081.1 DUF4838 domain-containing protein [Dyadobacter sp. LHD-138]
MRLLLIVCYAISIAFATANSKNELIAGGKSEYKIFVSRNASKPEHHAARELQKYLDEISGCRLSITNDKEPGQKLVYIGFKEAPQSLLKGLDIAGFGKEEFIIRADSGRLLIAGGNTRGTLYGVISYLSDHLGCRWYTREVVKIPKKKTVFLSPIDDRQQPRFEAREMAYRETNDLNWVTHNRLNHSHSKSIPDSLGGGYVVYPWVHTAFDLVSPDDYFEKHPEYFALIDGKRSRAKNFAQLCLTNLEVVKIATAKVFEWIKTHPEADVYTVDQNDGDGYCQCKNCKAIDDREESHSGSLLHFVNQIADTVAKVYPRVELLTLAYAYTEIPPKTIRPADNVTIRLCHYDYCSAHALGTCNDHKQYIERFSQWSKIAKRVRIWDYYTNFERYLLPFPNFEAVKHDLKFYADHNVKAFYAEGSNVPDNGGGEFTELRAWVFSQLMWNPERDGQALIDEFVTNVYNNAAPYISQYIKMMHDQVKSDSTHFSIWEDPEDVNYLNLHTIRKADSLFMRAREVAVKDPALLKRVERAYLPVLYTRLYFYSTGGTAFLEKEHVPAALAQFKRILADNRITGIGVVELKPGNLSNFIKTVESPDRFITDWWTIGPFDNTDRKGYAAIYPPEQQFDTTQTYNGMQGSKVKWNHYRDNSSGYIDFRKLFNPKKNVVSYAFRGLSLPAAKTMKFGVGSNDGVKVWINGKLVLDRMLLRPALPNDDEISVPMKKGDNTILIKVDQTGNKWGFYFTERN